MHFHSFMCVVGTVVSSKLLSCTLLEKDVKDDVSIERYLSSKSEIIGDGASINHHRRSSDIGTTNHRNHQYHRDYNSSHYFVFEHGTKYAKVLKGTLLRSKSSK